MKFRVETEWPRLPRELDLVEVAGIDIDEQGNVYLFNRGLHPVVVVDFAGELLAYWGHGVFSEPHGIRATNGLVYCADYGDHTVRIFTPSGELLRTLGEPGKPSDTGAVGRDWSTVRRAGPPFNAPTDVEITTNAQVLVSDGYGNTRLHRFSSDGLLISSIGSPGAGPEQFCVPHSVCHCSDGRLYVCDRENCRVQVLSLQGQFLDEITGLLRPDDLCEGRDGLLYIAELGYRSPGGMRVWQGNRRPGSRISAYDQATKVARPICIVDSDGWGGLVAAHSICTDNLGNLYVGDTGVSASRGRPPSWHRAVHKFVAVP